jgi:hypothetical protein
MEQQILFILCDLSEQDKNQSFATEDMIEAHNDIYENSSTLLRRERAFGH